MCILNVNVLELAHQIEEEIRDQMQCLNEILFAEITPSLSAHSGAGMMGIGFVVK